MSQGHVEIKGEVVFYLALVLITLAVTVAVLSYVDAVLRSMGWI